MHAYFKHVHKFKIFNRSQVCKLLDVSRRGVISLVTTTGQLKKKKRHSLQIQASTNYMH
jgi:hypothetical protein